MRLKSVGQLLFSGGAEESMVLIEFRGGAFISTHHSNPPEPLSFPFRPLLG